MNSDEVGNFKFRAKLFIERNWRSALPPNGQQVIFGGIL